MVDAIDASPLTCPQALDRQLIDANFYRYDPAAKHIFDILSIAEPVAHCHAMMSSGMLGGTRTSPNMHVKG